MEVVVEEVEEKGEDKGEGVEKQNLQSPQQGQRVKAGCMEANTAIFPLPGEGQRPDLGRGSAIKKLKNFQLEVLI